MSSSYLTIFCIILVSIFVLHQCENMEEDLEASKIVVRLSPCARKRCSFSLFKNCHCCRGKYKYCSKNIKVCEAECLRLNPPGSPPSLHI
ncbi:PREDICTED: EMBRYO SURROUNDING FACTOR 1-like protein 11 [Camelina sativa]|uniref:EMBRYO SURROUNDING FACTOR 1-like protein 11 n=1 Tax=Camelina sativa TaxID=90675 RepID=A0ABM0WLA1_CAMSA|nr:PREDICTED: EMBRYO SURROUNDING FACTOR 1-like protein 11 [Camelina sativa]